MDPVDPTQSWGVLVASKLERERFECDKFVRLLAHFARSSLTQSNLSHLNLSLSTFWQTDQ